MKISEQRFIWCRCDASLGDAQEIINFLTPFCKHYFIGHHSKGRSDTKPPHFHFYLTFLNISMNNFREKFKKKFPKEVYLVSKYNSAPMKNNKVLSPAYILAKPYEVPYWTNDDELDWEAINRKIEELMKFYSDSENNKVKHTVKQSVNIWLNKLKVNQPELECEALKADTYFTRKLLFKKIFSYIMIEKVKNEEYINRNSLNELVYNIFLRISSVKSLKKVIDETSEMVFEKYFGEGPGTIDVVSNQGFGFELES